jgi:hypothetical protein
MQHAQIVAAVAGHYVHLGVIRISVTNLAIIGLMVAVFAAALLVPFPGHRRGDTEDRS